MLEQGGPSTALRNCTLVYAAALALGGLFLLIIEGQLIETPGGLYHQISRAFLFGIFIFENCFVQLIFTQHWAFMSSVQTREEAAVWFAPIAGIGSIASTTAAFTVAPITDSLGLVSLLILAGLFMLLSAFFAMDAYRISVQVCARVVVITATITLFLCALYSIMFALTSLISEERI